MGHIKPLIGQMYWKSMQP
uniref:Uncharacterized protein n=1 Tax=Rhizophora mucronata TaxID=61149 RepID=A0A2P2QKN2_RHIMU